MDYARISSRLPATWANIPALPPQPLADKWQAMQGRLWIQVDCKSVADLFCGRAILRSDDFTPLYKRLARLQLIVAGLGRRPRRDSLDCVVWSPREYNPTADHIANMSMDMRSPLAFVSPGLMSHIHSGTSLRLCVDGGRRSCGEGALGMSLYGLSVDCRGVVCFTPLLYEGLFLSTKLGQHSWQRVWLWSGHWNI